ncbi:SAV_2336 N-terminal domain-related protein [Streptomyces vietnamensis]|uniref:SAV_2336 N-terminal domain-related protein n=1 Tax=Streptomyces vietnamensis TaxID=362257 RepID=UPI003433D74F
MTSEQGEGSADGTHRSSNTLGTLARLLGRVGDGPPTGRELAELLWLARQMDTTGRVEEVAAVDRAEERSILPSKRVAPTTAAPPREDAPASEEPPRPASSRPAVPPSRRVPLRTPAPASRAPGPTRGNFPLLVPQPPMLARPLDLQRSLRPLRRTVASTTGWELDETATVDRIASLGTGRNAYFPVLRPQQERWLHLRIVFDSGPTMTMWRPLVRELYTTFAQTGAFRTLDVLRLGPDGRLPLRHRERGRTAALVVSDAMGTQWRGGPAGLRWRATLAALGAEMPVALLQPLPERLWRHTAAPAHPGRFVSPAGGVPNSALTFTPYDGGHSVTGMPIPVLELCDKWLGHWAALVASPSGVEVPGAAAFLRPGKIVPPEDALVPEETNPEELVLRFHTIASPQAFRLAAHLAVGSAHLPVMRLVQAAVEERPSSQHLAEIVLSGMLRADPDAGPGAYDFRPGVRDLLLGALPRTSLVATVRLLARVSAEIEARAGMLPPEFRALVESLDGQNGERAAGRPFALVSEESVRLLRGPERPTPPYGTAAAPIASPTTAAAGEGAANWSGLIAERYLPLGRRPDPYGDELLLADDEVMDRRVLLRVHPHPAPAGFLARVDRQRNITHPHFVQIHSGLELDGRCAVVLADLPGTTLRDLLFGKPDGLDTGLAMEWAGMLCSAVVALHDSGLVHGRIRTDRVLLSERGEPVLTEAAPYLDGHRAADDLYDLGRLLYELATGRPLLDGVSPLSPREVRQDVPFTLEQVVLGLLSFVDEHRHEAVRRMAGMNATGSGSPRSTIATFRRPNYRLLGPVKAWFEPLEEVDALILARLLLARGNWVPVDDLRSTPPDPLAEDDLRDRLARLIADGHPIDDAEGGARIVLRGGHFDLAHAEKLLWDAGTVARSGDRVTSARLFRAARLLLREPLAGLRGSWAETERRRLLAMYESREKEFAGVLEPDAAGSRLRVHVSEGGRASDSEVFKGRLQAQRTETGSLLTDYGPVQAMERVVQVAEQYWAPSRGGMPATVRIALAGEETDEAVLDEIAEALPAALAGGPPRRRMLLTYPSWVHERNGLRLPTRQVPGHDRWMWLEVASVPPLAPPTAEGGGGFLGRLLGRLSPRDLAPKDETGAPATGSIIPPAGSAEPPPGNTSRS